MTLQDRLDAFKADFKAGKPPYHAPPEIHPIMERATAELLAQGPLVVTFYRGVWCPYCNIELHAINEALPQIRARGANVVAISPQTAVNSRKSVRDNSLNFPVLSDAKGETAAAFGLRFSLPDYLVDLYKNLRNDLPAFNDDPSWTLPMPARYVIGHDGIVLYSEVNPDYTHRPDPAEMFAVLDKANAKD
jgi:peroxiredoxin